MPKKINKPVVILTDNDGDVDGLKKRYENYLGCNEKTYIKIHFDENIDSGDLKIGKAKTAFNYNTLEPKLLKLNGLKKLNAILGTSYTTDDKLHKYMRENKTECALKIFSTDEDFNFPDYILKGVE